MRLLLGLIVLLETCLHHLVEGGSCTAKFRDRKVVTEGDCKNEFNPIDDIMQKRGWHKAAEYLYFKHFTERKRYNDSVAHCSSLGGRLISKSFRYQSIARRIESLSIATSKPQHYAWIGSDDIRVDGTWVWSDGNTTKPESIEWEKDQPSGTKNGKDEDCGHILFIKNQAKVIINDLPCDDLLTVICEKEY